MFSTLLFQATRSPAAVITSWSGLLQSISRLPEGYGWPLAARPTTARLTRRLSGILKICPSQRIRRCRIARGRLNLGVVASSRYERPDILCRQRLLKPLTERIIGGVRVHVSLPWVNVEQTACTYRSIFACVRRRWSFQMFHRPENRL